jgi:hypothetical protein
MIRLCRLYVDDQTVDVDDVGLYCTNYDMIVVYVELSLQLLGII